MKDIKPIVLILCISFIIVYGLRLFLRKTDKNKEDNKPTIETQSISTNTPLTGNDIKNVINALKEYIITNNTNKVVSQTNKIYTTNWIGSPVTQYYIWDKKKMVWKSSSHYRSPPTILIGLKSDGTVIWKRKNYND